MSFTTTVIYPRKESAKFDLDYYNKTHMPLVLDKWGQYGFKSYHVVQFAPDAPYSVGAFMTWESEDGFKKAVADKESYGTIMEDVPKFSSEAPTFLAGGIVSRS